MFIPFLLIVCVCVCVCVCVLFSPSLSKSWNRPCPYFRCLSSSLLWGQCSYVVIFCNATNIPSPVLQQAVAAAAKVATVAQAKAKQTQAVAKALDTRISHLETVVEKTQGDKKSMAQAKLQVAQERAVVAHKEATRAQKVSGIGSLFCCCCCCFFYMFSLFHSQFRNYRFYHNH